MVPNAMFAGAALLGIGAFVSTGVSLASSAEAVGLGVVRNQAEADHARSLEDRSAIALGVGVALALAGAGLALASVFVLAGRGGPRLHIGVLDVGLSLSF